VIESDEEHGRDLKRLVVSRTGRLVTTGDAQEPYRVVGPGGEIVEPVSDFLRDLLASGKSGSTLRSYSVDLLATAADLPAADSPPVLAGSGSTEPGDGQARCRRRLCAVHGGA
jgi:hypothetical protein